MNPITCLLVIDFPDERGGSRGRYDHMHAWFESVDEAEGLKRRLEPIGGRHEVVEMLRCPRCGLRPRGMQ